MDKSKAAEFVAQHPRLVAAMFAALAALAAMNTFHAGVTYAQIRATVAEQARAASEALGG